jgi:hypothetical protein
MTRRFAVLPLVVSWLLALNASAIEASDEDEEKRGFTLDVALGWTATRGNDVQLGDRTTVHEEGFFDEETTFIPLITRMENDTIPFVRAGYRWKAWGVQGEYWQLETGGSLEGSFTNSGRGRSELVKFWDAWNGEFDDATSYDARNDLTLRSIRLDLTRAVARNLTLTAGLHVAQYENSRAENVQVENSLGFFSVKEARESESRVKGWLYGPCIGLRGSAHFGGSTRVGFSIAQSVLFGELDQEAVWRRSTDIPLVPVVAVDAPLTSRAAVPVTDLRLDLTFDLGDHLSLGGFAFVSAWLNAPLARGFSFPLEQWDAPTSTLVFASFGPMVKFRF